MTSLPNSPEKLNLTVVERVRSFENLNSASKYLENLSSRCHKLNQNTLLLKELGPC